jgi:3-isopropylmalate/(R)-2-methylmalate dehydratase small subunit
MTSSHRVWVYGDNVNTDVIFSGKYTYTVKTPEAIASHALEDLDARFASGVQAGDVVVGGYNWGCGSSREQAVTALKYCGVRVIVASSFSGLYFRNCVNQGIHPIICPDLNQVIQTGDTIEIDYAKNVILASGRQWQIPPLSPTVQQILNAGGLVPMLKQHQPDPITSL